MVNIINIMAYGLLTSAVTAATIKGDKHHKHHHRKNKVACSESTAPFPIANSTAIPISEISSTSAAAAASTQSVVTVSVIPVPVPSSSAPVAASSVYSSPAGVSSVGGSVPVGSASAGSACGGVVTTYVTVQQTVYVTATSAPASSTPVAVPSSSPAAVSSKAPCSSSSSAVSVAVPSSSAVSVPAPSAPIASAPPPVASAQPSTSAAQNIQSSVASTTSVAPATSSTPAATAVGSGPYTGPKMGISWDPSQNYDLSSVGLSVPPSWAYDWGQVAHGIPSGIQYVPTLHDSSKCAGFASDLAGSGATYVKHFNEPDESGSGGSGLSVSQAVSLHQQYIAPLMDQYLIGLPAVTSNNVPGTSGTGWLTSFVQQLGGCKGFKFADFHFYGGGGSAQSQATIFMSYVENWISTVDSICPGQELPIWISEFSATPVGDQSLATEFMQIVGPQLESNARIGRYAYWFPTNSEIDSVVAAVQSAVGL